MTPFELVLQHYKFPEKVHGNPFIPHPLQVECINDLAPLPNGGHLLDMGTGKTFVATACALYAAILSGDQCVVVMPPLLIPQWAKWLSLVKHGDGRDISVTQYKGPPAVRATLDLSAQFVLVGVQIFKKEFAKFEAYFRDRPYCVVADEATFIASIESDAHVKLMDFCIGHKQMMLTGTPANKPMDAYGIMKFTAPGTYRNQRHFENVHVEERDFFKRPTKYQNLEILNENLQINSKRVLFSDMYPGADKPLYVPIEYDLEDDHYRLYRKLAEEQLLKLPDGGKIDGTTANRLRHALGQIIINHAYFSGNDKANSSAINLITEKLHELGDKKLVVFADYKMSVAHIVERFKHVNARAINSTVPPSNKEKYKQQFIEDPKCRLLVIQFISGGKGLDGLQHVCHHGLFIEPCLQPRDFHQAVARLQRTGQRNKVWIGCAIAQGTLQRRGFRNLLDNDAIMNQVVRNAYELRREIYGD